ncbi:hypothetical protein TgHK011_008632 [Trichoderma gracile]|nr:hypothetical protein TgHK011_008632 [Trichoderma gracile]
MLCSLFFTSPPRKIHDPKCFNKRAMYLQMTVKTSPDHIVKRRRPESEKGGSRLYVAMTKKKTRSKTVIPTP